MEPIPEIDRKGLRTFGITLGVMIGAMFGAIIPFVFGARYPLWPWPVGAAVVVWALSAPLSLLRLYRGWMRVAMVINAVVSRIILGVTYYLVVLPTGAIMRLRGYDPMARKIDRAAASYKKLVSDHQNDMEKPF